MRKNTNTVTASEIGNWTYCPEQWRLSQFDHAPTNQPIRDHGTVHHEHKAASEVVAGRSIRLGRILIVAALLAMAAIWALSR